MTLPSLSDNETWWQLWINQPIYSALRNLVLIVIPNQFGKHVNRTFQLKIVNTQENITLLEKDKLSSKQKDVASTFNKHFGSITDLLNLFSWPEDTSMSSGNDTINSIIKKFAFHRKYKSNKEKLSFNHVSTETTKKS